MHHHQPLILDTKQAEPSTLLLFASLTHLPKPQLLSKPISFKFTATTTDGSVPDKAIHSGNGLAFVRVPDEFTIGRSRPWLGILNDACSHYKVFVVEFDTSYDPEFGDPNEDHVGIKLRSAVSFKTENSSKVNVSLYDTTIAH